MGKQRSQFMPSPSESGAALRRSELSSSIAEISPVPDFEPHEEPRKAKVKQLTGGPQTRMRLQFRNLREPAAASEKAALQQIFDRLLRRESVFLDRTANILQMEVTRLLDLLKNARLEKSNEPAFRIVNDSSGLTPRAVYLSPAARRLD
jgi:hypothetical protein